MYANKVKKIAAVHDLSGAGRVSLTVVIPILSSMGFQVCPLPTAVLSSHTQYPHFSFLDLTDEMPRIINEWKPTRGTIRRYLYRLPGISPPDTNRIRIH